MTGSAFFLTSMTETAFGVSAGLLEFKVNAFALGVSAFPVDKTEAFPYKDTSAWPGIP
jgi:hypothetical protein